MPKKSLLLFLVFAVWMGNQARADEETRQVQEELRKRHLFFRDIDGRTTPDYAMALRRYQERQGFVVTGIADETTLYSLGIGEPLPPAEGAAELPDIAVLKSDGALRELKPLPREPTITAKAAAAATKADIRNFFRRYLEACQSPNPQNELMFYADRVDYFDHGQVDKPYIQNELAVYDQRWPLRKYSMGDSIRIVKEGANTVVKFRVAFQVANEANGRKARGTLDDTFGLAKRGESGLEIVSIHEARIRRPSRQRANPAAAVSRSVRKVFRSIFR